MIESGGYQNGFEEKVKREAVPSFDMTKFKEDPDSYFESYLDAYQGTINLLELYRLVVSHDIDWYEYATDEHRHAILQSIFFEDKHGRAGMELIMATNEFNHWGDIAQQLSQLLLESVRQISYSGGRALEIWLNNAHMIPQQQKYQLASIILMSPSIVDPHYFSGLVGFDQLVRGDKGLDLLYKQFEEVDSFASLVCLAEMGQNMNRRWDYEGDYFGDAGNRFDIQKIQGHLSYLSQIYLEAMQEGGAGDATEYHELPSNMPVVGGSNMLPHKKVQYRQAATCRSIGNDYSVIIDEYGMIDSFVTSQSSNWEQVSLPELLREAGLSTTNDGDGTYIESLLSFKALLTPVMRQKLEEVLGFGIEQLQIREQLQLLNYLGAKKEDDFNKALDFINAGQNIEARIARSKVFFALESGFNLEVFFEVLKDKLLPAEADIIFLKYAEILALGYSYEQDLATMMNPDELSMHAHAKIKEGIFESTVGLLERVQRILEAEGQSNFNAIILNMLENYHTNILLSGQIFKEHNRKQRLSFEELENISFVVKDIHEYAYIPGLKDAFYKIVSLGEQGEYTFEEGKIEQLGLDIPTQQALAEVISMVRVYYDNYADKPELQGKLVSSFIDELFEIDEGGQGGRLYMYKEKEAGVMTFCKMLDQADGSIYAGGFNVNPVVQSGGIGATFARKVLSIESRESGINAMTFAKAEYARLYVKGLGFSVDSYFDYNGSPSLSLKYSLETSSRLRGMDLSELAAQMKEDNESIQLKQVTAGEFKIFLEEEGSQLFDEGFQLVRVERVDGKYLLGFEKVS